ncbi:heat shock protein DnaJ domain protein [Haloferax elongans ATCC BAA-1513]|uniref:Heat shock protein DnaJ domain protein n=1 Tax=Haloferax elongans ATCC BAA-1513 TaxID=1230453 RepID=M0HKV2_HALEO|nr:J domain-containing protein [Haloferax elongans]ELZ84423.1 heat shock protein DnaJ domain protein [Haloferax elongans ATCC BAA-1513]
MSDLDWLPGFERTPAHERTKNNNYRASLGQTTSDLETEMGRMDVDDWGASIGNQHTLSNSLPRHNARPDDPGFVMRWSKNGEQFAVACDRYSRLRDNVREVYKWIHETRMRSQRGVVTGEDEFAAARLPSADDVVAAPASRSPHHVLGVDPDASEDEVEDAYREKLHEVHPDRGGSHAEFQKLQNAKEAMLS